MASNPSPVPVDPTLREASSGQKLFGRYVLRKILGRGGMGVVWLAHDEELERDVALKFLPELVVLDKALLGDLKRETRRSLELTHKNVVRIYDFVQGENSACISMEYIDGDTLSNLRAEKEQKVFAPEEIAGWTSQLCDALDYAHNHARIIHRDLKPANLMVNQRGDLKVSDFGIARSIGDSMTKLTMASGGTSGTLVYMSPQQLDGERGTHLDDIYSLGATLYDLLTSKPPFYSGNVDRQVHERVAPSIGERRKEFNIEPASVPPAWEQTIAACLAKDPARRPQSAAEVAQRLQLSSTATAGVASAAPPRFNKKRLWRAAAVLCVVLAVGGWYFTASRPPHAPPAASPPIAALPEKSIAVLPFENMSEEKANAFFADGVQEEILTTLAKVADLKVISRTSVMQFRDTEKRNLRDIAQQLGVSHVLEGSVQRAANRVRVTAQLIDARTDAHVWAERYDRDVADVFAIQSEIAQKIAAQLNAVLSPGEAAAMQTRPTSDPAAYESYLRAREIFRDEGYGRDAIEKEVALLDQAVARDPAFVPALAMLAELHVLDYHENYDHTPARLERAKAALEAAARVQADAGVVHRARGYLYGFGGTRDYKNAFAELDLARRSAPNDADVLLIIAAIEARMGQWEESIATLERANALDPRNPLLSGELSFGYFALKRYNEVRRVMDNLLAWKPDAFAMRMWRVQMDIDEKADTSSFEKLLAEAPATADPQMIAGNRRFIALLRRDYRAAEAPPADSDLPDRWSQGFMTPRAYREAIIARGLGDAPRAEAAFLRARERAAANLAARPEDAQALIVLAAIDAKLGRKQEAIDQAERAVERLPVTLDAVDGALMLTRLAGIYAELKETDRALEVLEKVVSIPLGPSYGDLRFDVDYDPLREDPRFQQIAASIAPKP